MLSEQSPSTLRYMCDIGIGVALVVIVVRTWFVLGVFAPVAVSSGSMAPLLVGPHRLAACQACGFNAAVDGHAPAAPVATTCPNCGEREFIADSALRPGARVYIDRTAWLLASPQRWQTVVFRCRQEHEELCAKRIVGLPGEQIEIRAGDVLVNGARARKDVAAMRSVSQLVHDAQLRRGRGQARGWRSAEDSRRWRSSPDGFDLPGETGKSTGGIVWLTYEHGGPILDDCRYNTTLTRRLNRVGELRITGTFHVAQGGRLALRIATQACQFTATIDMAQGRAQLGGDDQVWATTVWPALRAARTWEIEFANFDGRLTLVVGGKLLVAEIPPPLAGSPVVVSSPVAIGGAGTAIEVTKLRLWRDVYYTEDNVTGPGWGIGHPVELGADEYFVLGDNSPNSRDSRSYATGGIRRGNFVGRPIGY